MLIVAGHLKMAPDLRKAFVEAHADLIRRARAYPGCLDLSISEDPVDPSRINMFELWESEAVLDAWRKISNPPKTGVQSTMEPSRNTISAAPACHSERPAPNARQGRPLLTRSSSATTSTCGDQRNWSTGVTLTMP